jgi:glycosyltransferase involved in cell wall biosynthesis
VRRADSLFTISEFSRREIERHCESVGIGVPKLRVLRLADPLLESRDESPARPSWVPDRAFFLCVSSVEPRKNQAGLHAAWKLLLARLGDDCPHLLCIGTITDAIRPRIEGFRTEAPLNRFVHFLEEVSGEELLWYYRNCKATLCPSQYEGWGLPVGESLVHGKLCLASRATSIPEVAGDLLEYHDPGDHAAIAGLVERALTDAAWLSSREERIRQGYRTTTWTQTATQVLQALGR